LEIRYYRIGIDSHKYYDERLTLFMLEENVAALTLGDDLRQIELFGNDFTVREYPAGAVRLADQIAEYFAGDRKSFEFTPIWDDVRFDKIFHFTDWQKKVWSETMDIPYGATLNYGELARRCGKRDGARAVGNALGKNPIPILVPCHRVVSKSGPGGFSTPVGLRQKKALILHELLNR